MSQGDLLDAQAEIQDLLTQLAKLREEQQAALDVLGQELQKKAKQDQDAETQRVTERVTQKVKQEAKDSVERILAKWKAHYVGQIADLKTQLHNASQPHGSIGSTAQLDAELTSAKQQIADLQRIKAEDGAAEQRAAEAHNQVNSLETQLRAVQAEAAGSSQALQEAQGIAQAMQEANTTLRSQLEAAKHNHQKAVDEMTLTVEKHAKQYVADLADSKSQHGDYRDSSGRGYKRPRDSSNGRDKRRS